MQLIAAFRRQKTLFGQMLQSQGQIVSFRAEQSNADVQWTVGLVALGRVNFF